MAPISSFFSPFLQVPPSSVEDLWSSEEKFKNVRSLLTRRSSINGGGREGGNCRAWCNAQGLSEPA